MEGVALLDVPPKALNGVGLLDAIGGYAELLPAEGFVLAALNGVGGFADIGGYADEDERGLVPSVDGFPRDENGVGLFDATGG